MKVAALTAVAALWLLPAGPSEAASGSSCAPLLQHWLTTLQGSTQDLCAYQGKVLLIVNTASFCGFTGQYKGLEALPLLEGNLGLRRPNQRSHVTITAEVGESMSIEELVDVAEEEASCEVHGLLKRPDEKYVTERAYDNPKFVEDMVRDVAGRLDRDDRVRAYVVESENFESIHNHSAYALIESRKG